MFTPVESSVGASLIQIATSSYSFASGKVSGCSSSLYSCIGSPAVENYSVTSGIAASSVFVKLFAPDFIPTYYDGAMVTAISASLTGLGTKSGSGCTSGHFLCGISRLRVRSIVASVVFTATAMVTRYLSGIKDAPSSITGQKILASDYDKSFSVAKANKGFLISEVVISAVLGYVVTPMSAKYNILSEKNSRIVSNFVSGITFGLGLSTSGMASPEKVKGFLSSSKPEAFDPSSSMIVAFAIVPNIFLWKYFTKHSKPWLADRFISPTATDIPPKMILGNVSFGIGWGLTGICPAPGILSGVFNGYKGLIWLAMFWTGYKAAQMIESQLPAQKSD